MYGSMEASKLATFSFVWFGFHAFMLATFVHPWTRAWEDWSWVGVAPKQKVVVWWLGINTFVWFMMGAMA